MNMIKKTQSKFIAITLGAISLVLVLILGVLNVCVYAAIIINASDNISLIQQRRGFIFSEHTIDDMYQKEPDVYMPEALNTSGTVSYMYVRISSNNSQPFITSNMTGKYSADEIFSIADKLIASGIDKGFYMDMMYEVTRDGLHTTVTAVDIKNDMSIMTSLFRISVVIVISSLVFVFIFSYYLSRWAIKPVKDALDKQRRFISDASHELKTPLTVISANADVLEGEIGNNKWLNYIQDQADRMNILVNDLLSLSRLENNRRDFVTADFDLSRAITNAALPFECQAFESGKNFVLNIEEGIRINGSEQHIKQMAGIFIDNALKYSKDNGTVRVSLITDDNKAILAVYNTGSGVPEEDVDKLFERFYRSDSSRARSTGGYGLGLAIAKSIIDKHKFKVQVENQEGKSICFVVTM